MVSLAPIERLCLPDVQEQINEKQQTLKRQSYAIYK